MSTRIWPSVPGPAPIPITGTLTACEIERPRSDGMHSSSTRSAPAASSVSASSSMRCAAVPSRPCTRKPPVLCTDCGLSPRCAQTAMSWRRQELDDLGLAFAALELDHARPALLHQAHRIRQRELARRIAHEGQIGDQKRPMQSACHRGAVVDHVIHGHRHGRVMSLDDHAEGVADQRDVDPGLIQPHRKAGVINGQAGDLLAALLHLSERAERDRWSIGVAQLQLRVHGRFRMRQLAAPRNQRHDGGSRARHGAADCSRGAHDACAGSPPAAPQNRPRCRPDRWLRH